MTCLILWMWHTFQMRRGGTPRPLFAGAWPGSWLQGRTRTWEPIIAELTALASQEATSEAVFEELFWKLRLRRTEDELKTLQQNADLSLSQQQRLQELQELRLTILETIRSR